MRLPMCTLENTFVCVDSCVCVWFVACVHVCFMLGEKSHEATWTYVPNNHLPPNANSHPRTPLPTLDEDEDSDSARESDRKYNDNEVRTLTLTLTTMRFEP